MGYIDLISRDQPWVHSVDDSQAESAKACALSMGLYVAELDAQRMETLDELFAEYAEKFLLPAYFGRNWPALAECMTELTWLPARGYLTVILNANRLLIDEPEERPTFLRHLKIYGQTWSRSFALGPEWGGGEVPFNTLFVDVDGAVSWLEGPVER